MENVTINCSLDYLNELIKHQIIEPKGNNRFVINTKPNLRGEIHQIEVLYSENKMSEGKINKTTKTEIKTIEQWYEEFRKAFPNNVTTAIGKLGDGTNLRSGKKDKIINSLKELIKNNYSLENVVMAVKYEVWFRIKESKRTGDNKLEYMQRMGSWINNNENLNSMIERAAESKEFKKYLENENKGNDGSKTSRKAKIV